MNESGVFQMHLPTATLSISDNTKICTYSMKILGYTIEPSDNDSFMNPDLYEVNICKCLDFVKNRQAHLNPTFKLTKKGFDLSYTYDGYLIVSDRFRMFCQENQYREVDFFEVPNHPNKFLMVVENVVKFDAIRRETQFLEFNLECNEHNEVIGANPVCLSNTVKLADGFYRTDLEFGRGYAKTPLIVVGVETGLKLKAQKFKGLYLEKIKDKYEWES